PTRRSSDLYVINPGLEHGDMSAWELVNSSRSTDAAYSGSYAIHFWDQDTLSAKQHFTNLPNGEYELSVHTRIGVDEHPIAESSVLYAAAGDKLYTTPLEVTGWDKWKKITVSNIVVEDGTLEIGVLVNEANNDYGDFDDWELIRISGAEPTPYPSNPVTVPVEAPILTAATIDGKTVLTAKLSDTAEELKLSIHELNRAADADIVIEWGQSTIVIGREQLEQSIKDITIQGITVKKEATVDQKQQAGHADVAVLKAAGWKIIAETMDGSEALNLPLLWTDKLQTSEAAASVALYQASNDQELIYKQGIGSDYSLQA